MSELPLSRCPQRILLSRVADVRLKMAGDLLKREGIQPPLAVEGV